MMSFYGCFSGYEDRLAAITDSGERITYGDLRELSLRVSSAARGRSVVFALCENSIGSFAGCAAFLDSGLVPLLIDADIDRKLLANLISVYQPEYLYVPERCLAEFAGHAPVLSHYGYHLLATGASPVAVHEDLALLLSTSGSTGSPKLVRQSYGNLAANGRSIVSYLRLGADERPITTLPMHYTYGFSILNSHWMVGAAVLLTKKTLVEKGFWDFLRGEQATSFGGVPYTFETLKRLRFFRMDLPSIKTITQAGGKLSIELTREVAEFAASKGIRFFVMYGQTEATARMSYLPPEQAVSKCGSIGVAIPGGEFLLVDERGETIPGADQAGELVYRGANVTLGYAESRADLSKGDERGGLLFTGDVARRDSDGYYYITGRQKRFIKLFGNRINLDEVEQLLKTQVADCACAGTDDRMLVYVTQADRADALRQFVSLKTGVHPSAFVVKAVPEIPRNESGKTLYSSLLEASP